MNKYYVIKSAFLTANYWVVVNKETGLGQSFWPTFTEATNAARDLNNDQGHSAPVKAKVVPTRHLRVVS